MSPPAKLPHAQPQAKTAMSVDAVKSEKPISCSIPIQNFDIIMTVFQLLKSLSARHHGATRSVLLLDTE